MTQETGKARSRPQRIPTPFTYSVEFLFALVLGLAVFLVYFLTTCPTIYVGDSGDLTAAAALLGVAHPTGYPLYCLLGKLFITVLPLGSVAWRMNLLSAALGAAGIAGMYVVLRVLGVVRCAALGGALAAAFSLSLWGESTVARVYTLSLLLTMLAFYYLVRWTDEPRRTGRLWGLWITLGLGLANHVAILAVIPGVSILMLVHIVRSRISPRRWLPTVLGVLPGLMLYLYVPIRAAARPALNWAAQPTWNELARYFTRADYWHGTYVDSAGKALRVLAHLVPALAQELTWPVLVLVVVGIVYMFRRGRSALLLLFLSVFILNLVLLMMHGRREDLFYYHRYLILGLASLGLLASVGLGEICGWIAGGSRARSIAAWLLALTVGASVLVTHYRTCDRSGNFLGEDINRAILEELPQGATLKTSRDNLCFPLFYLWQIENVRRDVRLEYWGMRYIPAGPAPEGSPLFTTDLFLIKQDTNAVRPEGLSYHVMADRTPEPPLVRWHDYHIRGLDDPGLYLDDHCQMTVSYYYHMQALNLEFTDVTASAGAFVRSAEVAPFHPVAQTNAARGLLRLGKTDEAVWFASRALRLEPESDIDVLQMLRQTRPREAQTLLLRVRETAKRLRR